MPNNAGPEHDGLAVVDAPRAVDPDHVVEVTDAEHHVAAGLRDPMQLVDDGVRVEPRGVRALGEVDERVAEYMHALLEHPWSVAHGVEVVGYCGGAARALWPSTPSMVPMS